MLGLVITTLLVNILGGGGDAGEVLSLGKDMASVPSQVFQEEQTGGISMFNVHLPTAIGSGVVILVAIILLYLCYRRMQKRQMDLARNGQGERGNERELNVLYSAPPPYNGPMFLQNPTNPSWMAATYPALHPPLVPERSTSLPMEEIVRRDDLSRDDLTNNAIRNT